ncbi:MAG TPA: hypothetical protein VNI52_03550 [Sphingobacteriaceae bacterium]|nr:hypothetical protein [Sphingobacteriaceae bacterium]
MGQTWTTDKPSFIQIAIYFDQKGFEANDAEEFFKEYDDRSWKGLKGIPVKNWRAKALDWMWQKQKASGYLRSRSKLFMS